MAALPTFNPLLTYTTVVDIFGKVYAYQNSVYYDAQGNAWSSLPPSLNGYAAPSLPVGAMTSTYTFATLPGSGTLGQTVFVSDVGLAGTSFVWTGTVWEPSAGIISLAQSATPYVVAPNATWNNTTGAFTLGTALPTTYAGAWVYFSGVGVNSSTGGPAASGLYWCIFSSATVGQAYTNSTASTQLTTTAGTMIQTINTNLNLVTVSVQGGLMGANGSLRVFSSNSTTNSGGTKLLTLLHGGATAGTFYTAANSVFGRGLIMLHNRGVASQLAGPPTGGTSGSQFAGVTTTILPYYGTVNTAVTQSCVIAGQIAVATDFIVMESYTFELLK